MWKFFSDDFPIIAAGIVSVLDVAVVIVLVRHDTGICWETIHSMFYYWKLKGSAKEPNISIYFFFPPITQWRSISEFQFTGGRGLSDF